MTYQTPELLLVGAAKNLVLGTFVDKAASHLNHDPGAFYTADFSIVDSGSW